MPTSSFLTQCIYFSFFPRFQDVHNQSFFLVLSSIRWLAVRLDVLCVLFLASTIFGALTAQIGAGNLNIINRLEDREPEKLKTTEGEQF